MALSKQTIRSNMHIIVDGREISKEELILISEGWSEIQENLFRKMLKQGGHFKLNGLKYEVTLDYNPNLRSDGNKDMGAQKIPGEDARF